ncbi:ABC transporter substrate-binding protein [Shimia ponticola]|uniref:ABC transporter substrate-binding protein n=1 Tax=Shimia ponticola TaxID=2582893 RepID=UPI003211BB1A
MMMVASFAAAFEIEDRATFGPQDGQALRIISTADIGFFEPMIQSYLAEHPDERIDYIVASSTNVMQAVQDEANIFDIAISSAMDLQTKLANDGYALRHVSEATQTLPDWAKWNDMLFAFTEEPAAIVVSKQAFNERIIPRTRHDLIEALRREPERFQGRVGTYDVRQSGLGYLFATQDTRASETFWRLAEVLGALDVKLYCCSSDMIDDVKSGDLLIAYNVLGSYVANRDDRDEFEIIMPEDFTTIMLRTVLIPTGAKSPDKSREFIDHVLATSHDTGAASLIDPALGLSQSSAAVNRIVIGPGLLVFLDQLKRRAFLTEWESAILQEQ